MDQEQQALIIIRNLLLEVDGLSEITRKIIFEEFEQLIDDLQYRSRCITLDLIRFYIFRYSNLHSILTGLMLWDRTNAGHDFWAELYSYLIHNNY